MDSYDVLVIGGGATGTAAALSAARAGARVALVRRGPGAAALAAGGWRDAPPAPVREALASAGLELAACDGPLPHPDGTAAVCELAGLSHAAATLSPAGPATIVCGIAGLPGFHAPALARLWSDAAALPDGALHPATVTLDDTPPAGWSPASLAALLDRQPERLAIALAKIVRESGAERVILPAVLGLACDTRVRDAIADAAGAAAGEALGTAPSVPGWRLDRALQQMVVDAGVHVISGRVIGLETRAGAVRSIRIEGRSAPMGVAAAWHVLATGKYLAGGITAEAEFEEPALGCDVALERFARTIDDPGAALVLTDPVRTEPQPVLAAGVRTDTEGRPLTPAGEVYLANVFVAGSVRAGTEAAALGLGAAMHDGWAAGERAAALAAVAGR
ncbi:MAG TPA: FAD-binding protein [Longimicrobiales bacterium]|nr:FAD-binding protein [Longimicrobiales bacterium]